MIASFIRRNERFQGLLPVNTEPGNPRSALQAIAVMIREVEESVNSATVTLSGPSATSSIFVSFADFTFFNYPEETWSLMRHKQSGHLCVVHGSQRDSRSPEAMRCPDTCKSR